MLPATMCMAPVTAMSQVIRVITMNCWFSDVGIIHTIAAIKKPAETAWNAPSTRGDR